MQLQQSNSQDDNLAHAEGLRENWEEEEEEQDIATDANQWANQISPSHLLEAANMLEGGSLLDWVDLPSSSFLFGFVGGEWVFVLMFEYVYYAISMQPMRLS